MRTLFGIGATGEIIKQIQSALTNASFDTNGVDGWYGQDTANAVNAFQEANGLPVNGTVDDETWLPLMRRPIPSVSERSLQLTAAFEGHGFGLAVGNFDGALLTWGIIGFTMLSGELQKIVLAVNQSHPELVQQAFGAKSDELLKLMTETRIFQKQWADEHTLPNRALAEPWRSMFALFGSLPEVQQLQVKQVQNDYMTPGVKTATGLGLQSELGLALCFDIHVQNGGIKSQAMEQIRRDSTPGITEGDLRVIVANAVADWADPAWSEDVRRRKLTIATGNGIVHGHEYVLENWGLSAQEKAIQVLEMTAGD